MKLSDSKHKLTCFVIMTLFPFYKNMLQFSGWSCSYKNGALLAKFQPGVLYPFVLICGCLLYCTCDGCCPPEQCWSFDGSCPCDECSKNKQTNNNNALRLGFKPIRRGIFSNSHHLPWTNKFFRGLAFRSNASDKNYRTKNQESVNFNVAETRYSVAETQRQTRVSVSG